MHQNINALVAHACNLVQEANTRTSIPNTIVWHRLNGVRAYADFVIGMAKGHKSMTLKELVNEKDKLAGLVLQYQFWNKISNGDKRGDLLKSIFHKLESWVYTNYTSNFDAEKTLERGRALIADIFKYAAENQKHYREVRYRLFAQLQEVLLPTNEQHGPSYRAKVNALLTGFVFMDQSVG